jgi:ASC-1-like (ASCH) protein
MKALSLRQPYAELIVSGKKTIEVRNWNTKFRGEFLVHASKQVMKDDCKKEQLDPNNITTGAVVGKAKLVDVKKYRSIEEFEKDQNKHSASTIFFKKPCYGFVLENAERCETIPAKGSLNFFDLDL